MSIFILFNQEAKTHDIGRSKILGILTERWNVDMKHFSWPFNKIIQISFLTLFHFFEWISCHQGDCEDKFISGMCCRTLSSASVNKNTHVIIPAHRYSRRWTDEWMSWKTLWRHFFHWQRWFICTWQKPTNSLVFLREKEES